MQYTMAVNADAESKAEASLAWPSYLDPSALTTEKLLVLEDPDTAIIDLAAEAAAADAAEEATEAVDATAAATIPVVEANADCVTCVVCCILSIISLSARSALSALVNVEDEGTS